MKNRLLNSWIACLSGLLLFVFLFAGQSFDASSQVKKPFTQRTSSSAGNKVIYNIKGDFTMIGNTNLTLREYDATTSEEPNSNNDMRFVDIDSDANTINSSSATLGFSAENGANPLCTNIIYAGLYWSGRVQDGGASPMSFTTGVTTSDYNSSAVINGYTLTIAQSGNNNNNRTATYTFTPTTGNPVIFTFTTNSSSVTTLTVKIGNSGTPANVAYTSTSGTSGDNWVLATLNTPYVISTGSTAITVNSLRKTYENNIIDDDFYANVTYGTGKTLTKNIIKIKKAGGSYQTFTANTNDI